MVMLSNEGIICEKSGPRVIRPTNPVVCPSSLQSYLSEALPPSLPAAIEAIVAIFGCHLHHHWPLLPSSAAIVVIIVDSQRYRWSKVSCC